MLACDNCYLIPNATLRGHCCKTNLPASTAFRGFGAPQGMLLMETLMSHVASHLGLAPEKVCCDLDFSFLFFFLGVPGFFLGREVLLRLFFFPTTFSSFLCSGCLLRVLHLRRSRILFVCCCCCPGLLIILLMTFQDLSLFHRRLALISCPSAFQDFSLVQRFDSSSCSSELQDCSLVQRFA